MVQAAAAVQAAWLAVLVVAVPEMAMAGALVAGVTEDMVTVAVAGMEVAKAVEGQGICMRCSQ